MKAILLARVSSREQQEGMSIPAQERRLREYADRKGLEVFQVFAITESSTKDTRKEFQKILDIIEKTKEPIALVADTIDRVQRSFKESVVLEDYRKEGKVEIHFIREGLVLNTKSNSADILRWDMGVMFARSYVLQLSDNIKRSKEQSARNGIWMGLAPTGYMHSVDEQGNKTIMPDPNLAPFITKMFELYATDSYSLRKLQDELTKMGARTKTGKTFAISQLNKILKKPFYCGVMETKYGIVNHHYECLTSPETFHRVQEIIDGYQSKPHKTKAKPFVLKGMISCAHCGCVVTPEIKKERYVYYSCTNGKGDCKRTYVREERLLKPLMAYFDQISLSEEQIQTITEYLREIHHSESRFHKDSLGALRKEQDRIQRRIGQMYDDKLDGLIDEVMYLEKVKEYKTRQSEIVDEMKRHEVANQNFHITANMVLKLAAKARELFESSEVDEKRQLLNLVFQNLELRDVSLSVQVHEPFKMMMDYKSCPTNWRWRESNSRP
jgi:site-specific DNA recombinase